MRNPIFVVDAFSSKSFAGNPAGVCLLEREAGKEWMQAVAAEMRHAETAFLVPNGDGFDLRWFTPTVEVDLCGHATLAAAHVLYETGRLESHQQAIFRTRSGVLLANYLSGKICLDFPAEPPTESEIPKVSALSLKGAWTGKNRMDWVLLLEKEQDLRSYSPQYKEIQALGMRGLIVTAKSSDGAYDFISRFFAPQSGVDEDPVTGSAHCALGPFWAAKLGKNNLIGYQASPRGGVVEVLVRNDRVDITGHAITVLEGTLKA